MRTWTHRLERDPSDPRLIIAEHGEWAVFGCHVHEMERRIDGQDIRTLPDVLRRNDLPRCHVEDDQLFVPLTRNEGALLRRVDQQTMRVITASRVVPLR